MGVMFIILSAICTYVSYLSMKGKIKPNGYMGVRLNFSRNYWLYQQDKYWYPINRYGGEKTIYVAIAWMLSSLAITVLPADPLIKIYALTAVILLVTAALLAMAIQINRYAEQLVSDEVVIS